MRMTITALFARAQVFYETMVLRGKMPWIIVGLFLAVCGYCAVHVKDFEMDVSSDSIVLERDADLRYYDYSRELFGSDDYIVIVLTNDDLFSDEFLKTIGEMSEALRKLDAVESVLSILDVPLFHSPAVPLTQLATGFKTLGTNADRALARKELMESPLYGDYLLSRDGKTTAIQVTFKPNAQLLNLDNKRQALRDRRAEKGLTNEESVSLKALEKEYRSVHVESTRQRRRDIDQMRSILNDFEIKNPRMGGITEGGLPVIISDMVNYIERDIWVFGLAVIGLTVLGLIAVFRSAKWVILPTAACTLTTATMMGFLGLTGWQTTVVTSNLSSLLLIMTMSMAVHIVVRHRELHAGHPGASNVELVRGTVLHLIRPCFYMALTTVVGFGSLMVSGIRPVIDFGLMMSMGLGVSFVVCFMFLPAAMMLFPPGRPPSSTLAELETSPVVFLARFTNHHRRVAGMLAVALLGICSWGMTKLSVESRFIDYFKSDTVIHRGMMVIDERLGGTTPLEVVLDGEGEDYWLKLENLDKLAKVHRYLDDLPETGKVISLETLRQILQGINGGRPVPQVLLSLVRRSLPEDLAARVLRPYATPELDKARILMRVRESDKTLKRTLLYDRIRTFLESEMGYRVGDNAHITGYFVLYNNMLNSLFRSQVLTIGAVIGTIWVLFIILFRSIKMACILIVPNIYPVVLILGTMGWLGVHLDMMTIMIAAIAFGMAAIMMTIMSR